MRGQRLGVGGDRKDGSSSADGLMKLLGYPRPIDLLE